MPKRAPIHELPDGWREARVFVATDPKILTRLNLLALPLLLGGVLVMLLWRGLLLRWSLYAPVFSRAELPLLTSILVTILAITGVFLLHEGVHGWFIQRAGHQPRYGLISASVGRWLRIPVALYTTTDNALFRRGEFLQIALAPLVIISLAGMALSPFLNDTLFFYLVTAVAMNAGGAVGDVWMALLVVRAPAEVLVRDEADRIRLYLPE